MFTLNKFVSLWSFWINWTNSLERRSHVQSTKQRQQNLEIWWRNSNRPKPVLTQKDVELLMQQTRASKHLCWRRWWCWFVMKNLVLVMTPFFRSCFFEDGRWRQSFTFLMMKNEDKVLRVGDSCTLAKKSEDWKITFSPRRLPMFWCGIQVLDPSPFQSSSSRFCFLSILCMCLCFISSVVSNSSVSVVWFEGARMTGVWR